MIDRDPQYLEAARSFSVGRWGEDAVATFHGFGIDAVNARASDQGNATPRKQIRPVLKEEHAPEDGKG
jgi:hypothetical protein